MDIKSIVEAMDWFTEGGDGAEGGGGNVAVMLPLLYPCDCGISDGGTIPREVLCG